MFRNHWGLSIGLSLAATLTAEIANAQSTPPDADRIDALQAEIKTLEHEIQGLKRRTTAAARAYATATPLAKAAAAPAAIAKISPGNRPSICTADDLNCISLTSRLHFDGGGYWYRPNSALTVPQNLDSGVNARRARIGVLG